MSALFSRRHALLEAPAARRRQRHARRVGVAIGLLLVAGGYFGIRAFLKPRGVDAAIVNGMAAILAARDDAAAVAALDSWDARTRATWQAHREEMAEKLFHDIEKPAARRLLTRVSGADYGDRLDDWRRWHELRRRLDRGQQPELSARHKLRIEPRWQTPVGLTAWFSTILPLDGQVYVASLGGSFDEREDEADGLVRVDGASGHSQIIFTAREGSPHDIIGIAAGSGVLLVASNDHYVYAVTPDGNVSWHAIAGEAIVAAPLAMDVNRDRVLDAIVITRAGKVVALNGKDGRTLWVETAGRGAARSERENLAAGLGATLAAGDVLAGGGDEIVACTVAGEVCVISASSGKARERATLTEGSLSGALVRARDAAGGPPIMLLDRAAGLWAMIGTESRSAAVRLGDVALRETDSTIAALRCLSRPPDLNPMLLVCTNGAERGEANTLAALAPSGVVWRCDLPGPVWGSPAVADLNGDGQRDIVLAAAVPARGEARGEAAGEATLAGLLVIVSANGLIERTISLPSAAACPPVIADVDGDNQLEVLIADQAGILHCFATDGFGPVEWGLAGGDSHNTRKAENAFAWGQVPFGFQWKWEAP